MRGSAVVRAAVLGIAVATTCPGPWAAVAWAAPARDPGQAIERALTSRHQTELPSYRGQGELAPGLSRRDRRRLPRVPVQEVEDTRELHARTGDGALARLLQFLLWGVVAVGAVLTVVALARELWRPSDQAELADPELDPARRAAAADAAIIQRPLGDADELARRGEYAEAIHVLLLRTLQELARSASVRVERSHTSREILARVPLRSDAREALFDLITAVELTHFGDEPAGAADYERCRQQFHRFAAAFRAGYAAPPSAQAVAA